VTPVRRSQLPTTTKATTTTTTPKVTTTTTTKLIRTTTKKARRITTTKKVRRVTTKKVKPTISWDDTSTSRIEEKTYWTYITVDNRGKSRLNQAFKVISKKICFNF
jgi:hypothetical protein